MRLFSRQTMGFGLLLVASAVSADVGVEYVGHASFVVESPAGVRVVIDPFNSNRWLGYRYPEVAADVVLVTHPHYDHDASYYWGDAVPVFREPGRFRVGDVTLVGVEGRHADPYGRDFEQENTIWIVEAGGVRIAHLGDNGPLTASQANGVGSVDVLMVPADGDDHILKPDEIRAWRGATGDPVVIPMHYRLDGFLDLPKSLGPIGPWLDGEDGVVRVGASRANVSSNRDPNRRVLVFEPSPALDAWPAALVTGWEKLDQARDQMGDGADGAERAMRLVEEAASASPNIVFSFQWARALSRSGSDERARTVLESALARAGEDDWEYRLRAHALLGSLFEKDRQHEAAASQYRIVLRNARRTELLDEARAFFAAP